MQSEGGKKRSKSYYRKCAHGGKKQRLSTNVLEPGIQGFLVMCNHNEKSAVRESYNILNEYADIVYGQDNEKQTSEGQNADQAQKDSRSSGENTDEEDDDVEKALKKEVEAMKNISSSEKRFQNVMTKAKNCVFIRTTLKTPVKLVSFFMEDIALKRLKRARFAARILPIIGTCKANTSDIEKLASQVLPPMFSPDLESVPKSYTILFKTRNNNGNCCGREGVVSALIKVIKNINSDIQFTWSSYSVAVLVEIVCTVCCIGVAPNFIRLRKYNLQELTKGALTDDDSVEVDVQIEERNELKSESDLCGTTDSKTRIDSNSEEEMKDEMIQEKNEFRLDFDVSEKIQEEDTVEKKDFSSGKVQVKETVEQKCLSSEKVQDKETIEKKCYSSEKVNDKETVEKKCFSSEEVQDRETLEEKDFGSEKLKDKENGEKREYVSEEHQDEKMKN